MLGKTKPSKKPVSGDTNSSSWSVWNVGKALIATVATLTAGAVGFSLISNLRSENNAISLDELASLDLKNPDLIVNADYTATQIIPETVEEQNHVILSASPACRKLLSASINVVNPINPATQVIDAVKEWQFPIGTVFSGDVQGVAVNTSNNNPQPTWLGLDPSIAAYDTTGNAVSVSVINNVAYVADSAAGLTLINVAVPNSPVLLAHYPTVGSIQNLVVSGSTVYVTDGVGLKVINLLTPSSPTFVGGLLTNGTSHGLAVVGTLAYVAVDTAGLQIIDVSIPSNPISRSVTNTTGYRAYDVWVNGTTAYIANDLGGLQLVDVTNPTAPNLLGAYDTPGNARTVVVAGSVAYVADGTSLQVLSVSAPLTPTLLNQFILPGNAIDITLNGPLAYVADDTDGVHILDVSDLNNLRELGRYTFASNAKSAIQAGNLMYVAADTGGLMIADITQPTLWGTPTVALVGQSYTLTLSAWDSMRQQVFTNFVMTVDQLPSVKDNTFAPQSFSSGTTLELNYNANVLFNDPDNGFITLQFYDVITQQQPSWLSVTLKPTLLGTYATQGPAYGISILNQLAYVAIDTKGLEIVNVADPKNLASLGRLNVTGNTQDVMTIGINAYLASGTNGFRVGNVTSSILPLLRGSYATTGAAKGVWVAGTTAYVAADTQGLVVVNINNPSAPTLYGTYNTPGQSNDVHVVGTTAYVADGSGGLQIISVSNPSSPAFQGYFNISSANGVYTLFSTSYVAAGNNGLYLIDVTNPVTPAFISRVDTLGSAQSVFVRGRTAYVANGASGFQVIDVGNATYPIILGGVNTHGFVNDVALFDTTLYVADSVNGLQTFDITPWQVLGNAKVSDEGNYRIGVTAIDELGATASDGFNVRIEGRPVFNSRLPNQQINVGDAYGYFIPQGVVSDPNHDALLYAAQVVGNGNLPSWLSFNAFSATFSGVPDTNGIYSIAVSVTDNKSGSSTSIFTLTVVYRPTINIPLTSVPVGREGKPYTFTVPASTFIDRNGNALVYSASLENSLPLPDWLQFYASNLTFAGTPPAGISSQTTVNLIATDVVTGASTTQNFQLVITVNAPPQLIKPIPQQYANVDQGFYFVVPIDTFADPNADTLTYTAEQAGGQTLLSWLRFDGQSRVFSGKPGRSDTGFYAAQLNQISVKASDGQYAARADFALSVAGMSNGELALKVGAPLVSTFLFLVGLYAGRAVCLNRLNKEKYQKLCQEITVGEIGSRIQLESDKKNIFKVQARITKNLPTTKCGQCIRFFRPKWRPNPGQDLPPWLVYHPKTHQLEVVAPGPSDAEIGELKITVMDRSRVISEQFVVKILPNFELDEREISASIPMLAP